MGQWPSVLRRRKPSPLPPSPALTAPPQVLSSIAEAAGEDHIADLPEELLALVFGLLSFGDLKRCSLVCHRLLAVEAASRLRLALDARAPLLADSALPRILARFPAVSKLALKCDRRAESVGDPALTQVADRLGPGLRRLKLRSLRAVTDDGVAALAAAATNLRKLSVGTYGREHGREQRHEHPHRGLDPGIPPAPATALLEHTEAEEEEHERGI